MKWGACCWPTLIDVRRMNARGVFAWLLYSPMLVANDHCGAPFTLTADPPAAVLEDASADAPAVLEDAHAVLSDMQTARDVDAGDVDAGDVRAVAVDAAAECRANYLASCAADPLACASLSLCMACPGACDQ